MRRMSCALGVLALVAIAASTERADGQTNDKLANDRLAARCAELGQLFDRYGARRGEGSGGPNLTRLGAALDCDKGRYEQGIKALEDLLRRNGVTVPPAA